MEFSQPNRHSHFALDQEAARAVLNQQRTNAESRIGTYNRQFNLILYRLIEPIIGQTEGFTSVITNHCRREAFTRSSASAAGV
jgi:hypothetical protein